MKMQKRATLIAAFILIITGSALLFDRLALKKELNLIQRFEKLTRSEETSAKLDSIQLNLRSRLELDERLEKLNDSLRVALQHSETFPKFIEKHHVVFQENFTSPTLPEIEPRVAAIAPNRIRDSIVIQYDTIRILVYDTIVIETQSKKAWKRYRRKVGF